MPGLFYISVFLTILNKLCPPTFQSLGDEYKNNTEDHSYSNPPKKPRTAQLNKTPRRKPMEKAETKSEEKPKANTEVEIEPEGEAEEIKESNQETEENEYQYVRRI